MSKLKKNSASTSFRDRLDYVVTACLYCWHRWISKAAYWTEIRALYIIRALVSCVLPKRYVYRICRNHVNSRKDRDLLFRDLECGQNIRIAKNLVCYTCGGYVALPLTIIATIICSLIGWNNVVSWKDGIISIVIVLTVAVLTGIGVYKTTKTIVDPRVYLSYFKDFQKQDEEWLRKWKRYTILLFVGGFLSAALGIYFVFYSFMHS